MAERDASAEDDSSLMLGDEPRPGAVFFRGVQFFFLCRGHQRCAVAPSPLFIDADDSFVLIGISRNLVTVPSCTSAAQLPEAG